MFRFANSELLYLLLLLPAAIVFYVGMVFWQKRAMKDFAHPDFFSILWPDRSPLRRNLKFIFFLLAIASLIIALARPQFGSKLEEVKREGIEMIIALDVSRSMLAEDIRPNRLERAKQAIVSMVNHMQDDKIGMIVFAGDAYTQLPITTDYISAKMFLSGISTEIVSKQGTAIGSAIRLAVNSFTQDAEASKVVVVISDGENHEGDALEEARLAAEKGIRVYTIGIGSPAGAPLPLSRSGGPQAGFLKDREGEVIISRMDPAMLSKIAAAGEGKFYTSASGDIGLSRLYAELNQLDKAIIETKVYSEYDDQFHYFLAFALLLLILDCFIPERKSRYFKNISFFENR